MVQLYLFWQGPPMTKERKILYTTYGTTLAKEQNETTFVEGPIPVQQRGYDAPRARK